MRITLACLVLPILLAPLAALPARAEERVLSFAADITVRASGDMDVAETIRIVSDGTSIKHGIFRDIPTIYRSKTGTVTRVNLAVARVERDGAPEPYAIEHIANGKRIKIGAADIEIPPGRHDYSITYRISNEIGFFETHDELYWNVNGPGWPFAMDGVEATVRLPAGARILDYTGYTGDQGETGKDFSAERLGDAGIRFKTTRALNPRENLTIVVTWPKGIVAEPTKTQKAQRFFVQNMPVLVAGAGLVLIFIYYLGAWLRVGRDPPAGTIVPLFHPPRGLGPADVRYIRRMGYDRKAFAAALVDLGVKGAVKIVERDHTFSVRRAGTGRDLTQGEAAIRSALLGSREEIEAKNANHRAWSAAQEALRRSLASAHGGKVFATNRGYFIAGLTLTILVAALTALASPDPKQAAVIALFMALWIAIPGVLLTRAFQSISSGSAAARVGGIARAVLLFLFFIPFSGGALVVASELARIMSFWAPAAIAVAAMLNIVFFELLKAPTKDGRKLMDEIEGLRLYLSVAEVHRLNLLNPPEETPQTFETYLPFAMALDVENEWNQRFAGVLARAAEAPGESHYSPSWYSGPRLSRIGTGTFASALGGALASATASAATAPGSSSGMSGGSSGGGGGGGGGGGW